MDRTETGADTIGDRRDGQAGYEALHRLRSFVDPGDHAASAFCIASAWTSLPLDEGMLARVTICDVDGNDEAPT